MTIKATLLALAGALALSGAAAARPSDNSVIVITYNSPKAYSVTLGGTPETMGGAPLANGAAVPAGTYTFLVDVGPTSTPESPEFTVTGPGVSIDSNLSGAGGGVASSSSFGPYALAAGSSYTIEDKTIGASSSFTFSASVNAPSGASTSGGSQSSGGTTTPTTGKATVVATLAALLPAAGKPRLTLHGKAVTTLKPGFYEVNVADRSKRYGLALHQGRTSITLSGEARVGASSRRLMLSVGRWSLVELKGGTSVTFDVSQA
jgi:hypothetical protein